VGRAVAAERLATTFVRFGRSRSWAWVESTGRYAPCFGIVAGTWSVVLLMNLMRASANLCGSSDCVPASLVESSKFPATSEGSLKTLTQARLYLHHHSNVSIRWRGLLVYCNMYFINLDLSLAQLAERCSIQPQKGHFVRTMMTKRTI
jgi:hypothetical protein